MDEGPSATLVSQKFRSPYVIDTLRGSLYENDRGEVTVQQLDLGAQCIFHMFDIE